MSEEHSPLIRYLVKNKYAVPVFVVINYVWAVVAWFTPALLELNRALTQHFFGYAVTSFVLILIQWGVALLIVHMARRVFHR